MNQLSSNLAAETSYYLVPITKTSKPTYSYKTDIFGKLQGCLRIFFLIGLNMIKRCTNKKRKNREYRNGKIFSSAII